MLKVICEQPEVGKRTSAAHSPPSFRPGPHSNTPLPTPLLTPLRTPLPTLLRTPFLTPLLTPHAHPYPHSYAQPSPHPSPTHTKVLENAMRGRVCVKEGTILLGGLTPHLPALAQVC